MKMDNSIYLHIPFCKHRCAYCDFNTYASQENLIPAYVDALIREISYVGRKSTELLEGPTSVHTVFLGGGTPSLLSGPQLISIMDALRAGFAFHPEVESTLEANPGTTSPDFLRQIHAAGINRLSFGVQSANPEELHMLERVHDFFEVIRSIKWARQAGFNNLNLDLIYGLPEQTLDRWQNTVKRIVDLYPEHISAYALTLEHGTPFGHWSSRGLLPIPDPDLAAEMYEWAGEYLEENGYAQYEISNWARSDSEWMCRHNLQYWRGNPYLGLGAGAHGYANGLRYSNVLRIKTYIERLAGSHVSDLPYPLSPAVVNHHRQMRGDDMGEFMLTGLRLTREGISSLEFESRFGTRLEDVYGGEVKELIRLGLIEWQAERLRLTQRGRLLGNLVFMRFVD
jgi:oxygen-independent coproporphyrinogen III oxidase